MPDLLYPFDAQVRNIDALYGNNTFHVALIDNNLAQITVPQTGVNVSTNALVVANDFANNMRVRLSAPAGGVLPEPFNSNPADTIYYVMSASTTQFLLSLTRATSVASAIAIDITTQGTGGVIVTEQPLGRDDGDYAVWLRHELVNYQGSVRQAWTPGGSVYVPSDNATVTVPRVISWYPTNGDLANIRYLAFMKGSGAAPRTSFGNVDSYIDLVTPQVFRRNTLDGSYSVRVRYAFG
ncbi:MAG TPA: hypothetical protein VIQ31_35765 [Phormidium sp.]